MNKDENKNMNRQNTQEEQEFFLQVQKQGEFKIQPCDPVMGFNDKDRYEMLKLTKEQKMQVNELLQHVPMAAAAGAMAGAYTVSFPKGLPHTLLSLKQGGVGSQIIENGRIVGSASFHQMLGQTAVLGAFTAISVITGQFFLAQITKELHMINKKIDDIQKFLYGEKKAELLSEVSFVKYACENYGHIMAHEQHRIATICSIQGAKKVAIKDVEFYMNDFYEKVNTHEKMDFQDLRNLIDRKIKYIRENLDLSLQLCLISSLMEVYYSENYEEEYINYVENDIKSYIKSSNKKMLESYGNLKGRLVNCKVSGKERPRFREYMQKIEEAADSVDKNYQTLCDRLSDILHTTAKATEYYLTSDGNVYYKKSLPY